MVAGFLGPRTAELGLRFSADLLLLRTVLSFLSDFGITVVLVPMVFLNLGGVYRFDSLTDGLYNNDL